MGRHGTRGIFNLEIDGKKPPLMAFDQGGSKTSSKWRYYSHDFFTVSRSEKISSKVGISIAGEEELIQKGLVLQTELKEVEVLCASRFTGSIQCRCKPDGNR